MGQEPLNLCRLGRLLEDIWFDYCQFNAVVRLVRKGAWQVWRVRHCASGAYLTLLNQSSHNVCEELCFLWGFHISWSWQDWWGWLPLHVVALVEGWKAADAKAARGACSFWLSVETPHLSCCGHACYAALPFHCICFFEVIEEKIIATACVQQEPAGKQFLLTSAHTPAGKSRSFIKTLCFA